MDIFLINPEDPFTEKLGKLAEERGVTGRKKEKDVYYKPTIKKMPRLFPDRAVSYRSLESILPDLLLFTTKIADFRKN